MGHRLQGTRTESYQALRCPTCGEGIFVLPRSPLPEPKAPAESSRREVPAAIESRYADDEPIALSDPHPAASEVDRVDPPIADGEPAAGVEADAEIDWVDPDPAPEPAPTPTTARPPKPRPAAEPAPMPEPATPRARPDLRAWAWRRRNALAAAMMVLVIVGAIGFRRHRQRLESLPKVVELGRTAGLRDLDAGEFQSAKKILADAAAALDELGGSDRDAAEIRQGAREAAIYADLASEGLDQILAKAATFDVAGWPGHFATFYKGRSIILEAPVIAGPAPYQVGVTLLAGRGPKPTRGRIDLDGFRLFELAEPKVGTVKTFGARLASLELDATAGVWVFRFEPDSGVEMTHPGPLAAAFGPGLADEEPGP